MATREKTRDHDSRRGAALLVVLWLVGGCASTETDLGPGQGGGGQGSGGHSGSGAAVHPDAGLGDASFPDAAPDVAAAETGAIQDATTEATEDATSTPDASPDAPPPQDAGSVNCKGELLTIEIEGSCECPLSPAACKNCVKSSVLQPGKYRIEYMYGAATTKASKPWNGRFTSSCASCGGSYKCWSVQSNLGELPGFVPEKQAWQTALQAESANAGSAITVTVTQATPLKAWYHDNICEDSLGSITYCIEKL